MSILFFNQAGFNEDISDWDVGSIKDVYVMIGGAKTLNDNSLSNWDVEVERQLHH